MARAIRGKPSIQFRFLLLFTAVFLRASPCGFSRGRQQPLQELREQAGTAVRKSASGLRDVRLSREETQLMGDISRAGEKRDWRAAKSFFGAYAGSCSPIYSAAMHAAWRCRMNKEGAMIYESCRANCHYIGLPTYSTALRIFGKLRDEAMVQQIWDEALAAHDLDVIFHHGLLQLLTQEMSQRLLTHSLCVSRRGDIPTHWTK
eukprot:Skav218701  [mRNA]  locus=scaffold1346:352381:352992:- [translate_table: standard]